MDAVLETERLLLRELEPTDLDFVAEMLADPEVMRYYPKTHTRSEAKEWLDRQLSRYARDGHGLWLAQQRESLAPVGQVGLMLQRVEGAPQFEIGYLLHRRYWGIGYATEAGLGVRRHAFEERGLKRVISLVRPVNLPSQAVARRLGMAPEREVEFHGLTHLVFGVSHAEARPARGG